MKITPLWVTGRLVEADREMIKENHTKVPPFDRRQVLLAEGLV
jgi:hypothetical protein